MTEIQQTVYVVEDDEAVRDSLELLLKSDSKPVKTYESANAFLKDYSDKMAGCIVLDIRMPGMDGMELQKKLNDKHSILPIIFVTGHGDVPMAVDAMKEGAVDFIQKPTVKRPCWRKSRRPWSRIRNSVNPWTKNRKSSAG